MADDDTLGAALEVQARTVGASAFATCWSYAKGVSEILSFQGFANASSAGAARLLSLGVTRGERCAMLAKGTIDFYVAVVSVQRVGCTPVLLNWRQALETLEGMVADTRSTTLLAGAPYLELGRELGARCGLERVLSLESDFVWDKGVSGGPPDRSGVEAAVFFTSGSTSRPKPVLHTQSTLLWTARHFVFPTTEMRTTLCFMPNFHVLMCFQNFLLPMARGVGCSIHAADATEGITSQMLLAAARALEPTTIDTVPFIMAEWSAFAAGRARAARQVRRSQIRRCSAASGGRPAARRRRRPRADALRPDGGARDAAVDCPRGRTERAGDFPASVDRGRGQARRGNGRIAHQGLPRFESGLLKGRRTRAVESRRSRGGTTRGTSFASSRPSPASPDSSTCRASTTCFC